MPDTINNITGGMNPNQKHWLVAGGIALALWFAYRSTQKQPLLPMKPGTVPAPATGATTNFTGYSAATGAAATDKNICANLQKALILINQALRNEAALKPSQVSMLRNRQAQIAARMKHCGGGLNVPPPGGHAGFDGVADDVDQAKMNIH